MNTHEIKSRKSAEAYWNGDFYLVETFSGRGLIGRDPQGETHSLQANASVEQIGAAVLGALASSRFLSLDQCKDFFDLKKGQERYKGWIEELMAQHGYKTKRALFKNMARCSVSMAIGDSHIEISPQHHDRLEGWGRTKDDGIEDVFVPADSSAETVGHAVLLAFTRCT